MTRPTGYIAMIVWKKATIAISNGTHHEVALDDAASGRFGMVPVFKTKSAARKHYGKGVELRPIWIAAEHAATRRQK